MLCIWFTFCNRIVWANIKYFGVFGAKRTVKPLITDFVLAHMCETNDKYHPSLEHLWKKLWILGQIWLHYLCSQITCAMSSFTEKHPKTKWTLNDECVDLKTCTQHADTRILRTENTNSRFSLTLASFRMPLVSVSWTITKKCFYITNFTFHYPNVRFKSILLFIYQYFNGDLSSW